MELMMEVPECARTSVNSDQTSDECPEQQITSQTFNMSIGELHLLHALFTPSYTILSIDTLFPLPSGDVNKKVGGGRKEGKPRSRRATRGEGEGERELPGR